MLEGTPIKDIAVDYPGIYAWATDFRYNRKLPHKRETPDLLRHVAKQLNLNPGASLLDVARAEQVPYAWILKARGAAFRKVQPKSGAARSPAPARPAGSMPEYIKHAMARANYLDRAIIGLEGDIRSMQDRLAVARDEQSALHALLQVYDG